METTSLGMNKKVSEDALERSHSRVCMDGDVKANA